MARASKKTVDLYFDLVLIICYILFGLLLLSSCAVASSPELIQENGEQSSLVLEKEGASLCTR